MAEQDEKIDYDALAAEAKQELFDRISSFVFYTTIVFVAIFVLYKLYSLEMRVKVLEHSIKPATIVTEDFIYHI